MARTGEAAGSWMRRSAVALAVTLLSVASASAAEVCTAAQRAVADRALRLTNRQAARAVRQVFPWGAPLSTDPRSAHDLIVQREYVIGYDADLRGPVWSADVVGVRPLTGGRIDCFRADPRLAPHVAATKGDFSEPIFDQGHMVPNGDMTFDEVAILNTFVMSNMSPQFCQFNRGTWQILETFVRSWSRTGRPLYVFTGAVFDRDGNGTRDPDGAAVRMRSRNGESRVAVPSMYYKILARPRPDGGLETLTILLRHDQVDVDGAAAVAYLDANVSSIATVEKLTDLKFFPRRQGRRVEATRQWSVAGFKFRSLVNPTCRTTAGARIQADGPSVFALPNP